MLPRLSPQDVVIHLSQSADGRVFMVTDRDHEAVVYQATPSVANTIDWKELRRLPSDREESIMSQQLGEGKRLERDRVAVTDDRLVVYTRRPDTVHSFDFRTGAWESNEATFRTFHHGLKATPDGLLIGMAAPNWIYSSIDYGRTWNRMDAFLWMTEPHFIDRRRGIMLAAEMSMMIPGPYMVRTTNDGGKTWVAGALADGPQEWMQPLWTDPSGKAIYTTRYKRIEVSRDNGQTWAR